MKDLRIGTFVNLITSGETIIGAAKKADIMDLPIVEVLEELAKEEYCSDWDILINDIANGE